MQQILADNRSEEQAHSVSSLYRWQRKAKNLVQLRACGKYLDNTQKRLVRRWQRCQAAQRAKGAA